MSRWHDECMGRCDDCNCTRSQQTATTTSTSTYTQRQTHSSHSHAYEDSYKRYMTIGPVRYGMRLGAVSPPPPGGGPRYRSQCCWPTGTGTAATGTVTLAGCGGDCDDNGCGCGCSSCDSGVPIGVGPVSRIPLLTTPQAQTINSLDIISCANRIRMSEDSTSEQPLPLAQQASAATVRDHVLYSGKCLLKSQLKRCALVRPQFYTRLAEYGDINGKEDNTLDRLPRFRFGGNRAGSADKRGSDQRFKELTDRLKRGAVPIPPPRTRHTARTTPPVSPTTSDTPPTTTTAASSESNIRPTPLRSASFSQVDYCTNDNKYIRRRPSPKQEQSETDASVAKTTIATLPRSKNPTRPSTIDTKPAIVIEQDSPSLDINSKELNNLFESLNNEPTPEQLLPTTLEDTKPDSSEKSIPGPRPQDNSNNQDKKRDKSRRRKGIYISQWPNTTTEDVIPQFVEEGDFPSCTDNTTKLLQDSIVEISKLQVQEDFPIWSSPQEEPLSPEENNVPPEWPSNLQRGRFVSQSPEEKDLLKVTPRAINLFRSDSLSEGEPDGSERKSDQVSLAPSDVSDCESRISASNETASPSRRYSKRPLRGPYGQMLEAEMKKPDGRKNINNDLKFLEDLSTMQNKSKQRSRTACNNSLDETQSKNHTKLLQPVSKRKVSADNLVVANENEQKLVISHQRTTSSPSKLEGFTNTEVSADLLEQLLRGSSEQLATTDSSRQQNSDTRTHVAVELYENELSYVESLEIMVTNYLEPLKLPENANLIESSLVDEIFSQIPFLLSYHQYFLNELKQRLENWDIKQKIGDLFLEMFSKSTVIENYTNYVNNWTRATEIIKSTQQSKPAFNRFLENTSREHKGKLSLDSLMIKPIQKFPKYELLIQRLMKFTNVNHPDYTLLLAAEKQVHEQLLKINCTEREALELEQLREIANLIDGLEGLAIPVRRFLRYDLVSMATTAGSRKERGIFLFSDLLLITSIKRRSGTIRRTGPSSITSSYEANKYKLLMKVQLEDLEIQRSKDDNLKLMMIEVDNLTEDIQVLNQISELGWSLHCNHSQLDEIVKDMLANLNKQLTEQQNSGSQLSCLDLTLNTTNGMENISMVFPKANRRVTWEEVFAEAKQKLAMSGDRKPCPEMLATVPIRKTRAGLQFTCAAPTLGSSVKDVWVCNSDGYVGQVCILSLRSEPTVTSCNGVCNARILCIAAVPGVNNCVALVPVNKGNSSRDECEDPKTMQFDSSSSSDEEDKSDSEHNEEPQKMLEALESCSIVESEDSDNQQSTMWLGTEDGFIHVYNCCDNIRIKKNKIKIQHGSSILSIIYLDNRVFVALANGDIVIYDRDTVGSWNINSPTTVAVGTSTTPVSKIFPITGKLWCGCGSTIKVFNTETLTVENNFTINNDSNKPITSLLLNGNGVWLSLQNSAIIKCFHSVTFDPLCEINVAPSVTKMLTSCDDIIRQHKAACLRVTALVACKDFLWIGTSAGVLLTMPLPHVASTTNKLTSLPTVSGVSHGHTGHVRFLTCVEGYVENQHRNSYKGKSEQRVNSKLLVISGGDGYEDFRTSNLSEVAGREDSTNHLLLWSI